MAKVDLTLKDLRKIRGDNDGYFRPTVPRGLLDLVHAAEGMPYQWDLEEVNGKPRITLEFNPSQMPSILSILKQTRAQE